MSNTPYDLPGSWTRDVRLLVAVFFLHLAAWVTPKDRDCAPVLAKLDEAETAISLVP